MPFAFFATFLGQLLLGIGLQVIGFLLQGKIKGPKPEEVKDLESPTAEAGRAIPVVFGEYDINGLNVLWFGQKTTYNYKVKA